MKNERTIFFANLETVFMKEIVSREKSIRLPDILFLSMDINDNDSIEIAKDINEKVYECFIIFYSDHIENATEVYKTEHLYFVLKYQLESRMKEIFHTIFGKQRETKKYIFSVIGGKRVILPTDEIIYFERVKRVTKIISSFGIYEIRDKLDDLIIDFPKQASLCCHNSFIVYLPAVREMSKENFAMSNQDKVAISRSCFKAVKKIFE